MSLPSMVLFELATLTYSQANFDRTLDAIEVEKSRDVLTLPSEPDKYVYTWKRPDDVHYLLIRGCGGGGGGAGGKGNPPGEGGNGVGSGGDGGIGASVETTLVGPLDGAEYEIQIGRGGSGGGARAAGSSGESTIMKGPDLSLTLNGGAGGRVGPWLESPSPEWVWENGVCATTERPPGTTGPSSILAGSGSPGTSRCIHYGHGAAGGGGGGALGPGGDGGNFENGIFWDTPADGKDGRTEIVALSTPKQGGLCAGGGGGPGGIFVSDGLPGAAGGHGSLTIIPIVNVQVLFDLQKQ